MQATLPAMAQGTSTCRKTHSESLTSEAHMEALFQKDEALIKSGNSPRFSRAFYPSEYYEKYHARMSPSHKKLAFHYLYLPQFINVPSSNPRRLTGSFISLTSVKISPQVLDQNFKRVGNGPGHAPAEVIWRGPKEDSVFPKRVHQLRTSQTHIVGSGENMPSNAFSIHNLIENSLARIYQSFANQGPERQILVPIVKEQDARDQERTTHFEYGIVNAKESVRQESLQVDEVGHMQIITSTGPHQPFHFEEQWGKIDRVPGEAWGEAGRFILKHWELLNSESQNQTSRDELKTIKYRLMHKVFAWVNNDARLDRLFFQVNDRVREKLLEMGWPLETAEATRKTQEIKGEKTQEWLFRMDRSLMIETEKRMLKKMMLIYFGSLSRHPDGRWFEMTFDPNEIKTLIKLGVIRVSKENPTPFFRKMLIYGDGPAAILHNPDPSAAPVFTITPEQAKGSYDITLIFSAEMIQKLISGWSS